MEHVEKFYPVVGVLEDLPATFAAMENLLPRAFFRNMADVYRGEYNLQLRNLLLDIFYFIFAGQVHRKSSRHEDVSEEAKAKLKDVLKNEYIFYDFIKRRLKNQIEKK